MNFRKAQSVRLVIADDHPIFRDGLRRLLEAEADFKVLGEASDGAEAVKLARQLKPDILLLDLSMPKHPGLEALRELSVPATATPVRVILLTAAAEKRITRTGVAVAGTLNSRRASSPGCFGIERSSRRISGFS